MGKWITPPGHIRKVRGLAWGTSVLVPILRPQLQSRVSTNGGSHAPCRKRVADPCPPCDGGVLLPPQKRLAIWRGLYLQWAFSVGWSGGRSIPTLGMGIHRVGHGSTLTYPFATSIGLYERGKRTLSLVASAGSPISILAPSPTLANCSVRVRVAFTRGHWK